MKRSNTREASLFEHLHINPENLTEKQKGVCRKLGSQSEYFDANDAMIFVDIIRDSSASTHDKRVAVKELLSDHFAE